MVLIECKNFFGKFHPEIVIFLKKDPYMESYGQRLWTTAISKIITKCYILDVTAVLDPPLMEKFMESFF